jgi:hypothetical protein
VPHREIRRVLIDGMRNETIEYYEIAHYVESLALNFRARYNLACFYAGLADERDRGEQEEQYYERAYSELSASLRAAPPDLVKWARHDPSLAGLRENPQFRARVETLFAEIDPRAKPDHRRRRG